MSKFSFLTDKKYFQARNFKSWWISPSYPGEDQGTASEQPETEEVVRLVLITTVVF